MLKIIILFVMFLCINIVCETVNEQNRKLLDLDIFDQNELGELAKKKGITIPGVLRNLYSNLTEGDTQRVISRESVLGLTPGITFRSFYHQGSSFHQTSKQVNTFHLRFNLSTIPVHDKLRSAKITINRDLIFNSNTNKYRVLVHNIIKPGSKANHTQPELWLLDSKPVNTNKLKFVILDVWPAVREWIRSPHRNYGLLLEIMDDSKKKYRKGTFKRSKRNLQTIQLESWTKELPLLITYTYSERRKRSLLVKNPPKSSIKVKKDIRKRRRRKNICKRHPYTMDFNDLDFGDWISGPPTFNAYFCQGSCPFPLPDIVNATNHSTLRMLANNAMPGTLPRPCCAPTRLSHLTLLYLDITRTVRIKKFEDMIIEECGCI